MFPISANGQSQDAQSDYDLVNVLEITTVKGFAARCAALESHPLASSASRRYLAAKLTTIEVGLGQCLLGRPKIAKFLHRNERILRPLETVAMAGSAIGVAFMVPNLLARLAGEKPNKLTMGIFGVSLTAATGFEVLRASNKAYAMFDLRSGKRTKLSAVSFPSLKSPGLKMSIAF